MRKRGIYLESVSYTHLDVYKRQSVIYDAVAAAKARNADVLLCDTAGRLHNKKNLMEELRKIYRILELSLIHIWMCSGIHNKKK